MARAIRKHLGDFLAVLALFVLAIGIGGYILSQERLRFPFIEEEPLSLKVELSDAQAVIPGQGQTVRVAGVKVGDIGTVDLEDGKAVVEMQIDPEYKGLIKKDATALLRTKTGLKDMFLEVDPGSGQPMAEDDRIPSENTAPDIDPDEVLSALDADTRDYLKLLVASAGKGLKGRGTDLRETFRRFEPLHRDLARLTKAIARRRGNLKRLVHTYGLLTKELADHDNDLTRLVTASDAALGAFAAEDDNLSEAIARLPGALTATRDALVKATRLGKVLGPSLESLRPAFRKLDEANAQVLPLAREGTPIVRDQLRPFTRIATPYFKDLGEAGRDLAKSGPDLSTSFEKLNRLFNIGAFNPNGQEGISEGCETTGACTADERNRQESYLYWLGWTAHNTTSLFNSANAHGVARRLYLGGLSCSTLVGAGGAGADRRIAGNRGGVRTVIKQTPSLGRIIAMVGLHAVVLRPAAIPVARLRRPVPLKPEGYRFKVAMPEAATLAVEADVRMAGVNVGKVKTKELDKDAARTIVEMEIKPQYAPIPKNARVIQRQKTLLGETYVEVSVGDKSTGDLEDGSTLPNVHVEETVQLDEIFNAFDEETRDAFKEWVAELSKAIKDQRGESLNDAFGNLEGFAVDGAKLLKTLDEQEIALRRVIKNTGVVFGALNEREGQLRELIVNSNNTFEATASRDRRSGRDLPHLPDVPRRVEGHTGSARGLLPERASAHQRPQGPGGRPRTHPARPGRPGARPEGSIPRPRPTARRLRGRPPGARADRRPARAVLRERPPVLPRAQPDPVLAEFPPEDRCGIPLERGVQLRDVHRRPPRPGADRRDRRALVPEVQRAPDMGARQRLHGAQHHSRARFCSAASRASTATTTEARAAIRSTPGDVRARPASKRPAALGQQGLPEHREGRGAERPAPGPGRRHPSADPTTHP